MRVTIASASKYQNQVYRGGVLDHSKCLIISCLAPGADWQFFLGWRYGSERARRSWPGLKWVAISKLYGGPGGDRHLATRASPPLPSTTHTHTDREEKRYLAAYKVQIYLTGPAATNYVTIAVFKNEDERMILVLQCPVR